MNYAKLKPLVLTVLLGVASIFLINNSDSRVLAVIPNNAPTNLTYTPQSTGSLVLNWTDRATNEMGYKIDRASDSTFTRFKTTYSAPGFNIKSYTVTGMTEGSKEYFRVYAYNNDGVSGFSNTITGTTYLKTPTKLTANLTEQSAVNLTWTDASSTESNYVIERKIDSGEYSTLTTLPANSSSYTDLAISNGHTYSYKVKATKSNGAFSLYSDEQTINSTPASFNAPSSLTANLSGEVILNWVDNSTGEQGFKIERSLNQDSGYTEIGSTLSDINSFIDTNITELTQYYYRVRAFAASTYSDYSETANCTTPLKGPSNLSFVLSDDYKTVNLSWSDNSQREDKYIVERRTSPDNWVILADDLAANSNFYKDTVNYDSLQYIYRVKASESTASVQSTPSNEVVVDLPEIEIVKEAPASVPAGTNLTYTLRIINHADRQINDIQIKDQLPEKITFVSATLGTVDQTKLFTGTFSLDPLETKIIEIVVFVPLPINAPTNLRIRGAGSTEADVEWDDNSNNEEGFILERSTKNDFTENLVSRSLFESATALRDWDLIPSTTYYYRIKAYSNTNSSGFSNTVSATTTEKITVNSPTNLKAVLVRTDQIDLTWDDNSNNETWFNIYKSTDPGFSDDISEVISLDADTTHYQDTQITLGETYYYRIVAQNVSDIFFQDSDYSNTVIVTVINNPATQLSAPSALQAKETGNAKVTLRWMDNDQVEEYFSIERSTSSNFDRDLRTFQAPSNSIEYQDQSLEYNRDYYYRVKACRQNICSAYSNISTVRLFMAPSNLQAQGYHVSNILVTWTDNTNSENHFILERSTYPDFAGRSTITIGANETTYVDSLVEPNRTYYYRIRAVSNPSVLPFPYSPCSNTASAETLADSSILAPTNLRAETIAQAHVYLQWEDNSDNEEGFYIQISTSPDFNTGRERGGYGILANKTSFLESNLSPSTTYYFRIRAYRSSNYFSGWSNTISATTQSSDVTLANPTNLTGTGLSVDQIKLEWQDNSDNETGFRVIRSTSDGPGGIKASIMVSANTTSFIDSGSEILKPGTTYFYTVIASRSDYWGEITSDIWTAESIAVTTLTVPIQAPTNLETKLTPSLSAQFTWQDNSQNETNYIIERSPEPSFTNPEKTTLEADSTSYTDSNLNPNNVYYYHVRATINAESDEPSYLSGWSNTVTLITNETTNLTLGTPSNPTVSQPLNQLTIGWTDNADNEDGFVIEKSLNSNFDPVQTRLTVGPNVTGLVDSSAVLNTTYYYRIRAYKSIVNEFTFSSWSSTTSGTLVTPSVSAPTSLAATPTADYKITLTWQDRSNDETGFFIENSTTNTFSSIFHTEAVGPNTTSFTDSRVLPGQTYYYRVKAYKGNPPSIYSGHSNIASATVQNMPIAAPSNITLSLHPDYSSVNWQDNSEDESGFEIQRSLDPNFNQIAGTNITTYNGSPYHTLDFGTDQTNYFRVRAYKIQSPSSPYYFYSAWTTFSLSIHPTLSTPTNLTATKLSSTSLRLNWQYTPSSGDKYIILENNTGDFTYTGFRYTDSNGYIINYLTTGKTYYYKVRVNRTVQTGNHFDYYFSNLSNTASLTL